jgi:nucleoprotein TPR
LQYDRIDPAEVQALKDEIQKLKDEKTAMENVASQSSASNSEQVTKVSDIH